MAPCVLDDVVGLVQIEVDCIGAFTSNPPARLAMNIVAVITTVLAMPVRADMLL